MKKNKARKLLRQQRCWSWLLERHIVVDVCCFYFFVLCRQFSRECEITKRAAG